MTDGARIIVCDDDDDLRDTLAEIVARQGFTVASAANGAALRRLVPDFRPDLVLLDLNMPGEDGLSLIRWLRAEHRCAIVMLTAMAGLPDRVVGLEMGADDYIAKPVEPAELRARLRAVLRRTMAAPQSTIPASPVVSLGRCRYDPATRRLVDRDGAPVDLTALEADLLDILLAHVRKVVSRDQIRGHAVSAPHDPDDRSVDNRVARLRRKIESDPARPRVLRTIRGEGYMLLPGGD